MVWLKMFNKIWGINSIVVQGVYFIDLNFVTKKIKQEKPAQCQAEHTTESNVPLYLLLIQQYIGSRPSPDDLTKYECVFLSWWDCV